MLNYHPSTAQPSAGRSSRHGRKHSEKIASGLEGPTSSSTNKRKPSHPNEGDVGHAGFQATRTGALGTGTGCGRPAALARPRRAAQGFTLIELLVTLALAVILASLATPSMRDSMARSRLSNLGNEFTSSVLRARNEAVNRNTCVTLCMSRNAGANAPACTTTGADWQVGWIAFFNPACDRNINAPADFSDLLLASEAAPADYRLQAQDGKRKMIHGQFCDR
ncbi:prepilin-type N-terminal cleavage/methylation domain-containing protein [Verminephrobacter aporrectodeae subsp. tuberculatae]|uniref:GspH/FimT family pseudopilin n=1 Tax=Verminephrobacter aporrectodeae TaxID=1110389 RepID=UPI002243889C|nr:GspH/FimT family pseudopilin [Verminephrobacter aporrectodeae]MCW8206767.1 prepilin-type N-terminal cleavage/methylation domain-containing protein [Verminephrobacter aporrectodeae subsp. tuberculatae]